MEKKYIAVFCSAANIAETYIQVAKEFARIMSEHNYHLVWGGSNQGLMKVIADEVEKAGGELIGVTIDVFNDVVRQNITETIVSPSLGERKATMLLRADAIVVLAGGLGTIDEVTEVMELKKQGKHNKPIVILNTANFYEGLRMQFTRMQDEGFMHTHVDQLVYFANTPHEAMEYINKRLKH